MSLERLELCPKLQTAIVRGNKIESVPDLRCCPQLWKIDLANNVVNCISLMPSGSFKINLNAHLPIAYRKKITVWSKLDGPELDNAAYMSLKPTYWRNHFSSTRSKFAKSSITVKRPTDCASCYDFSTLRVFQKAKTSLVHSFSF